MAASSLCSDLELSDGADKSSSLMCRLSLPSGWFQSGNPPMYPNRSVYWSVFTPDILHIKEFNFQNFLPTVNVHDVYSASCGGKRNCSRSIACSYLFMELVQSDHVLYFVADLDV